MIFLSGTSQLTPATRPAAPAVVESQERELFLEGSYLSSKRFQRDATGFLCLAKSCWTHTCAPPWWGGGAGTARREC